MPQIEKPGFDVWKGFIGAMGAFTLVVAIATLVLWRKYERVNARIKDEERRLEECIKAKNDPKLIKLVNRAKQAILRPDQGKVESVQSFLSQEAKAQQLFLKNIKPSESKTSNAAYVKASWEFDIRNKVDRSKLTRYLYNIQTKKPGLVIEEILWKLDPKAANKWSATVTVSTFVKKTESIASKSK